MKANKGFTLIELLAVIVVLAIIALIATPVVLNSISTARTGADKESARAYVRAIELACARMVLASPTQTVPTYANAHTYATTAATQTFKGTTPTIVPGATPLSLNANCELTSSTATINTHTLAVLNS